MNTSDRKAKSTAHPSADKISDGAWSLIFAARHGLHLQLAYENKATIRYPSPETVIGGEGFTDYEQIQTILESPESADPKWTIESQIRYLQDLAVARRAINDTLDTMRGLTTGSVGLAHGMRELCEEEAKQSGSRSTEMTRSNPAIDPARLEEQQRMAKSYEMVQSEEQQYVTEWRRKNWPQASCGKEGDGSTNTRDPDPRNAVDRRTSLWATTSVYIPKGTLKG